VKGPSLVGQRRTFRGGKSFGFDEGGGGRAYPFRSKERGKKESFPGGRKKRYVIYAPPEKKEDAAKKVSEGERVLRSKQRGCLESLCSGLWWWKGPRPSKKKKNSAKFHEKGNGLSQWKKCVWGWGGTKEGGSNKRSTKTQ